MPSEKLPEPWLSFLDALEEEIGEAVDLHCIGGFVVIHAYGLSRGTAEIDVLASTTASARPLANLAGKQTPLHRRHGVGRGHGCDRIGELRRAVSGCRPYKYTMRRRYRLRVSCGRIERVAGASFTNEREEE